MCNESIPYFHNGPLTNKNKFKNWEAKMKKKTGKTLKEEDANLNSETVQRSLK